MMTTTSPPPSSILSSSCSAIQNIFPLSISFHSRTRPSRKGILISITAPNHKFPDSTRSIFCIFSSIKEVPSVDDVPKANPSQIEVKTSVWKWRGYSIRYQYAGNTGPGLVLLHGFGANSDHWRKTLPVLAQAHRVFAIDLIGYGYSDKPDPREFVDPFYTFETWASQLNDFCNVIVRDKAFFICNSIGGIVGLQAAVKEPQICNGIFLLNISLRMLHIKKQPWYGRPFIRSF